MTLDSTPPTTDSVELLFTLLTPSKVEKTEDVIARLRLAREEFHKCVCTQIQGMLSAEFSGMPHATIDEKKTASSWVNAQLRTLGIAIRCPQTGMDTMLKVVSDVGGGHPRYQLRSFGTDPTATYSSTVPIPLTLTPHFDRIEPGTYQRQR